MVLGCVQIEPDFEVQTEDTRDGRVGRGDCDGEELELSAGTEIELVGIPVQVRNMRKLAKIF